MFRWLMNLWHASQRATDLAILWPICKREARYNGFSLAHAKAVFAEHAFRDPAWLALSHDEIVGIIDKLE